MSRYFAMKLWFLGAHNNLKIHSSKFSLKSKWQEKTEQEKNHWIWNNVAWLKPKETEPNMKFKKRKTKYLFYIIFDCTLKITHSLFKSAQSIIISLEPIHCYYSTRLLKTRILVFILLIYKVPHWCYIQHRDLRGVYIFILSCRLW